MFKSKLLSSLLVAGSLAFSSGASAQTTSHYDFGILVYTSPGFYAGAAPNNFSNNPFAHLKVDDFGSYTEYTLSINNNLFSSFGPGAFLRSIFFDYIPDTGSAHVASLVSSNVAGMSVTNAPGPTIGSVVFDFGAVFGVPSDARLTQNKYVTWDVSGVGSNGGFHLAKSDVSVNNITLPNGGPYNAKYALLPSIPEPETYAMLLAGLGLLGYTVRRRKSNAA